MRATAGLAAIALAAATPAGCSNPDAPRGGEAPGPLPAQKSGEPRAPAPPAPADQAPSAPAQTPQAALERYAERYINWSWQTLAADQQALARSAVGAARLNEQQAAAATAADRTLTRAQVWNHGQLIAIAADDANPGTWVIVTREQTGGNGEYAGLPAAYHVTLARPAQIPGGYAVSQWQPQS